jgi:hypothetical protein
MSKDWNKRSLEDLLEVTFEQDEEILWVGRTNMSSYFLNQVKDNLIFIIICICIHFLIYFLNKLLNNDYEQIEKLIIIIYIFISFKSIYDYIKTRKSIYIITNYSLIIYNNFFKISTKIIYLNKIRKKELIKSILDKNYGTGTISVFIGYKKDHEGDRVNENEFLLHIQNSEKVFSLIKDKETISNAPH